MADDGSKTNEGSHLDLPEPVDLIHTDGSNNSVPKPTDPVHADGTTDIVSEPTNPVHVDNTNGIVSEPVDSVHVGNTNDIVPEQVDVGKSNIHANIHAHWVLYRKNKYQEYLDKNDGGRIYIKNMYRK
jgi:hypothetical protein